MIKFKLQRLVSNDKAVYGTLTITNDTSVLFVCRTIENKAKIFPDGTYPLKFEYSPRFKRDLWELYGIPHRSEIKIHVANKYNQLDGCVGVGANYLDIDKDGIDDIVKSTITLNEIHRLTAGYAEAMIEVVTI